MKGFSTIEDGEGSDEKAESPGQLGTYFSIPNEASHKMMT